MKYDLTLFDFDGTLADTFPWFSRVLNEVARSFGLREIDDAERERLRELGPRQILDELGVPLLKLPLIARDMRERMSRDREQIPLFPGVPELLTRLHTAGVRVGIVSSNSVENIRATLGPRYASLVAHYSCGSSLLGKPRRVRRVVAESRVPAARTILIGDEIRDAEAARRAGVAFGAVAWGYNTKTALVTQRPDEVFETIAELADRLTAS